LSPKFARRFFSEKPQLRGLIFKNVLEILRLYLLHRCVNFFIDFCRVDEYLPFQKFAGRKINALNGNCAAHKLHVGCLRACEVEVFLKTLAIFDFNVSSKVKRVQSLSAAFFAKVFADKFFRDQILVAKPGLLSRANRGRKLDHVVEHGAF
jgi:hypothetical protein